MTKTHDDPTIQSLKRATTPTLSGKSRLTYEVGRNDRDELCVRLTANTASGAFCQDWTRLPAILTILEKTPRHKAITSDASMQVFKGMSANMPGFTWAILLNEGLVKRTEGTRRYEFVEPAEVETILKALAEGQGATTRADGNGRTAKGRRGVPVKKPSASTKKKK
jgi:hypothetical protein